MALAYLPAPGPWPRPPPSTRNCLRISAFWQRNPTVELSTSGSQRESIRIHPSPQPDAGVFGLSWSFLALALAVLLTFNLTLFRPPLLLAELGSTSEGFSSKANGSLAPMSRAYIGAPPKCGGKCECMTPPCRLHYMRALSSCRRQPRQRRGSWAKICGCRASESEKWPRAARAAARHRTSQPGVCADKGVHVAARCARCWRRTQQIWTVGLVRAVNVWEVFCILNFRTTAIRGHTAVATAAFLRRHC